MIGIAAKIALGTLLYVAVLWAASRNPRAAGMMLTFPALNGLGLAVADPATLDGASRTMLLMPIVNGVMCAGYLAGLQRMLAAGRTPASAFVWATAVFVAVWLPLTGLIVGQRWGVSLDSQASYALAAAAGGIVLTLIRRRTGLIETRPTTVHHRSLPTLLAQNATRIALFALSLAAVAIAVYMGGPPDLIGVIASLPLVGIFGLNAIVLDSRLTRDLRRTRLSAMAEGIWLGPAVAIVFVAIYWRALSLLAADLTGAAYLAVASLALLFGWSVCMGAIWLQTWILSRLDAAHLQRSAQPRIS